MNTAHDEQRLARAREVLDIEIEALKKAREGMDKRFCRTVEILLDCLDRGGKIVVTGVGKSLHIGQKIAATLTSTGAPAVVLHPGEALHGDLGIVRANDAVIALSYSGESEELLNLVNHLKRACSAVIALTGCPRSSLARHSDAVIVASVDREACPFNMAPTASTTAALAMGDALAMVLLEARGFQRDDYAKLHPGGSIGRALLLRVADIMRTGDRVARVAPDAKVKDAVLAMTRARAGSVAVIDGNDRLLGIFTDGDLRRHIGEQADVLEQPIRAVMTEAPIALKREHLAVDVLTLFERHSIDDLPIVDDEGRLAGMIDIQDLPKLKIV